MISTSSIKKSLRLLSQAQRSFAVTQTELYELEKMVKRKMNVMRMFTELKEFNYQQPNMYYDKATGEIKVKEKAAEEKKKVIKNINDLEKEKQALFNEIGLDE